MSCGGYPNQGGWMGPDLHDFAARAPSAGLEHYLHDSTARSGTLRGDDLDPSGRPALSSR
jgi:hypothetical protein